MTKFDVSQNRKQETAQIMSKIVSDYFHQVDVSMGIVWQNNPIILILIGLIQFIFCSICALGFWAAIFDKKSYESDLILNIASFIEEKIKGIVGTLLTMLFVVFSWSITILFLGGFGYVFFKFAKMTHDSFVYNHELFFILK